MEGVESDTEGGPSGWRTLFRRYGRVLRGPVWYGAAGLLLEELPFMLAYASITEISTRDFGSAVFAANAVNDLVSGLCGTLSIPLAGSLSEPSRLGRKNMLILTSIACCIWMLVTAFTGSGYAYICGGIVIGVLGLKPPGGVTAILSAWTMDWSREREKVFVMSVLISVASVAFVGASFSAGVLANSGWTSAQLLVTAAALKCLAPLYFIFVFPSRTLPMECLVSPQISLIEFNEDHPVFFSDHTADSNKRKDGNVGVSHLRDALMSRREDLAPPYTPTATPLPRRMNVRATHLQQRFQTMGTSSPSSSTRSRYFTTWSVIGETQRAIHYLFRFHPLLMIVVIINTIAENQVTANLGAYLKTIIHTPDATLSFVVCLAALTAGLGQTVLLFLCKAYMSIHGILALSMLAQSIKLFLLASAEEVSTVYIAIAFCSLTSLWTPCAFALVSRSTVDGVLISAEERQQGSILGGFNGVAALCKCPSVFFALSFAYSADFPYPFDGPSLPFYILGFVSLPGVVIAVTLWARSRVVPPRTSHSTSDAPVMGKSRAASFIRISSDHLLGRNSSQGSLAWESRGKLVDPSYESGDRLWNGGVVSFVEREGSRRGSTEASQCGRVPSRTRSQPLAPGDDWSSLDEQTDASHTGNERYMATPSSILVDPYQPPPLSLAYEHRRPIDEVEYIRPSKAEGKRESLRFGVRPRLN